MNSFPYNIKNMDINKYLFPPPILTVYIEWKSVLNIPHRMLQMHECET